MQFSYWEQKTWFGPSDITIVGAGIVGLCSALELKKLNPGLHIRVLDAGILPAGATTRNAGFACIGSLGELYDDLQNRDYNQVIELLLMRLKGLQNLRKMLGDEAIGYQPCGNYELFSSDDEAYYQDVLSFMPRINQTLSEHGLGQTYMVADNQISKFGFRNTSHLLFNRHEGMLDSGMLYKALLQKCRSQDIEIIYNVKIDSYSLENKHIELICKHLNIRLKTKKLLICTNGFAKHLLPQLDVQPARGQVLVTRPIACRFDGAFHHNKGYNYFRNIDGRILIGGGRNLDFSAETTTELEMNETISLYLENLLTEVIAPNQKVEIEYRWSGIMGVGSTKQPIITEYEPSVFCAVRMGGMGVAIGSLCGIQAAELVSRSL